jgi:hypothetical protein
MKLWLVTANGGWGRTRAGLSDEEDPWDPWYDKLFGFVVRAETEAEARARAVEVCGDEVRSATDCWTNPRFSSCVELIPEGEAGIVIADFRAA